MATAWKILTSVSGIPKSGPDWSSVVIWEEATSTTDHIWEYQSEWEISATAVSQFGGLWEDKTPTWAATTEKWRLFSWDDIAKTKGAQGTETIV
jgi:hypothetical protein